MTTARRELKAMKLALQHDKMRREITEALRWALDIFEQFKARMPNDPAFAKQFQIAMKKLRASEAMTSAINEVKP